MQVQLKAIAVQLGTSSRFVVVERLDSVDYEFTLYTLVSPPNYARAYVLAGLDPSENPTTRTGSWVFDLRDAVGAPIVLGAGLGAGVDLLHFYRSLPHCPPGKLFVQTTDGRDPDLTAFAEKRAVLYYQPASDVAATGGST